MQKEKQKISVITTFTDGWEDRFAKAAYELYLDIEKRKQKERRL